MSTTLLNPDDEFRFTTGLKLCGIELQRGVLTCVPEDHPLVQLQVLFSWLSWAANGCRMFMVANVDREKGVITRSSLPELPSGGSARRKT